MKKHVKGFENLSHHKHFKRYENDWMINLAYYEFADENIKTKITIPKHKYAPFSCWYKIKENKKEPKWFHHLRRNIEKQIFLRDELNDGVFGIKQKNEKIKKDKFDYIVKHECFLKKGIWRHCEDFSVDSTAYMLKEKEKLFVLVTPNNYKRSFFYLNANDIEEPKWFKTLKNRTKKQVLHQTRLKKLLK